MNKHFDFIISEDKNFYKKVLRFYPKQSNVHGFNNTPPRKWEGVYKTYMTFSVLGYYVDEETDQYEAPYELFSYYRDEGEGLRILRETLEDLLSKEPKDNYEIIPLGDGVNWEIYKHKRDENTFVFNMLNSFTGQAFRFYLETVRIQEFYNILNEFLEYMLAHSQGI